MHKNRHAFYKLARQLILERLFSLDVTITVECRVLSNPQLSHIVINVSVTELGIDYMVITPQNRILAKKRFVSTGSEAVFQIKLPIIGYFQCAIVEMLGKLVYSETTRTYRVFFFYQQPNESVVTQFLYAKQLEEKKIRSEYEASPTNYDSHTR